jgi:ubiquinone biosynthesis protein UbiJ
MQTSSSLSRQIEMQGDVDLSIKFFSLVSIIQPLTAEAVAALGNAN